MRPMAKTPKTKTDSDRRTRAYTVRYSDDENREIADAAAEKALEVGSWIRMVSVEAARAQRKGGGR
jgi:hypothetical protein